MKNIKKSSKEWAEKAVREHEGWICKAYLSVYGTEDLQKFISKIQLDAEKSIQAKK